MEKSGPQRLRGRIGDTDYRGSIHYLRRAVRSEAEGDRLLARQAYAGRSWHRSGLEKV